MSVFQLSFKTSVSFVPELELFLHNKSSTFIYILFREYPYIAVIQSPKIPPLFS